MLIIFDETIINLSLVIKFGLYAGRIFFFFNVAVANDITQVYELKFEFKDEETAKKAFHRIIFAYANEYRTLDLSEYATTE